MTTFDDRKDAFENKYAHDKEMDFKVQARMAKLLARWAASKMGMAEIDAKTYMETPGTEDLIQMLIADFAKAGVDVTEQTIRNEMQKQFTVAREQMMGGN